MPAKIDFKTTLDRYRAKQGEFRMLTVPETRYLAADGHGDPNTTPAYTDALGALYPLAYALKAASRRELGRNSVVPPLEGLWWADDLDSFTVARDKSRWDWTMMLMVPDWIDDPTIEAALESRADRSGAVRLHALAEGRCVQTLHIGSFDDEAAVLARMHDDFLPAHDLRPVGTHHEVYLSDARRVAPERRRTILRQPVEPLEPADR